MQILERIEQTMRSRGLTQRKLCKKLGISDVNFTKWKRGRTGYQKHLPKIAEILGCTVEYLMTGQETPGETLYRKYCAASPRDQRIIDLILGDWSD